MSEKETNILNKLYFISGCMFIFALLVVFKLSKIQFVQGEAYRSLAEKRSIKNVVIPANRGNVYSVDGSLLATSVPKYDIRIDLVTSSERNFQSNVQALCDSISVFNGSSSLELQKRIREARQNKNRYFLLARNIDYSDYLRFRSFPLLNLGAFKGGLIVEQTTKRDYPLGGIAQRSVGYERIDDNGYVTRVGIDGAFGEKYLRGIDGKRLKQSIGKGQWKPIDDFNQTEPQDGYDVYTTIDVNIQDIAHHALLEQLEKYNADHGSVVVMETKTGAVRAISNLGRNAEGKYYERLNYAIGESHEPGSTFKLMALAVALEDQKIDTTTMVDTKNGILSFYGKKVRDSKKGGYGKISVAEAFEVSSNTGIVSVINDAYKENPSKFIDGLYNMSLSDSLGLPILGEGKAVIPDPRIKDNRWSGIALQWMAYGYGVSFTPLQTLTFYNAIANDGKMVKPRFIEEIKTIDKPIKTFETKVINPQICSKGTIKKLQKLLQNVVEKKHGTGHGLHSENFSMAGKTGTCQKDYKNKEQLNYISTFSGYFPAENPKYSCIVVIHEPDKRVGYYGADVSGPVFKKIAQKIYTSAPVLDVIDNINQKSKAVEEQYQNYFSTSEKYQTVMPNLTGLPAMDAIAILENMGLQVKIVGQGKVKKQSINRGEKVVPKTTVILELS
ncbi:MAG: penicillin-binding protein [Bacteroidetes bacterium]|nr:penicillin-binding protein [Bacteroidota bacterium]MDA0859966.1 penicillin-binding protein [Bacteroidota bacterium]MDA1319152.1 penicillin-binding protein [Bacteroidota bacterium]